MSVASAVPENGFDEFGLCRTVLRGIAAAGYENPRPIQQQAIPAVLDGRDILGLAQTGTGKTAAFVVPMLERIFSDKKDGPRGLIVAPTRELASQITNEIRTLGKHGQVRVAAIFGGVPSAPQIKALRAGPDVIVACPGRLLDLARQGAVKLDKVEMLVLDEADHMFDMGFLPDVRRILARLPTKRQNLLFSATMPNILRRLAEQVLNDPLDVDLTIEVPELMIEHAVYPVLERQKIPVLRSILSGESFVSAIVFTRTKHRAKRLALELSRMGHNAVAIQGNMNQQQRDKAMQGFRKHEFDVLVATDLVARGIDVERVSHVVNYDMPPTTDQYVHRIGRTGRSERSGKAYTLISVSDNLLVSDVERRIGKRVPRRFIEGITDRPAADAQHAPNAKSVEVEIQPEGGTHSWTFGATKAGPGRRKGGGRKRLGKRRR